MKLLNKQLRGAFACTKTMSTVLEIKLRSRRIVKWSEIDYYCYKCWSKKKSRSVVGCKHEK
jgi:hypothetical protein